MQPACPRSAPARSTCFNPHPPLRASATVVVVGIVVAVTVFQSSPAPEGECNLEALGLELTAAYKFQSSPAPEGECNAYEPPSSAQVSPVSILTRP